MNINPAKQVDLTTKSIFEKGRSCDIPLENSTSNLQTGFGT